MDADLKGVAENEPLIVGDMGEKRHQVRYGSRYVLCRYSATKQKVVIGNKGLSKAQQKHYQKFFVGIRIGSSLPEVGLFGSKWATQDPTALDLRLAMYQLRRAYLAKKQEEEVTQEIDHPEDWDVDDDDDDDDDEEEEEEEEEEDEDPSMSEGEILRAQKEDEEIGKMFPHLFGNEQKDQHGIFFGKNIAGKETKVKTTKGPELAVRAAKSKPNATSANPEEEDDAEFMDFVVEDHPELYEDEEPFVPQRDYAIPVDESQSQQDLAVEELQSQEF